MNSLEQLKQGYKPITFRPEAIVKTIDFYQYGNKGNKSVVFTYNDEELKERLKAIQNYYSFKTFHNKIFYNGCYGTVSISQNKSVTLRRKPKSIEFTTNSLKAWDNLELTLTDSEAHEIFKQFIDNLNKVEQERLTQELTKSYGRVEAYQVNSDKLSGLNNDLSVLLEEERILKEKIKRLKEAILEEKKVLAIGFIEQTNDINDSFKPSIINNITEESLPSSFPF